MSTTETLPIGFPVPGWAARALPAKAPIEGHACRLEPLTGSHAADLFQAWSEAPDDRDWTYMGYERPATLEDTRKLIDALAANDHFFAIVNRASRMALGIAAYIRVDPGNGVIEIAHINFSPRLKRTRAATEAIYLMISTAFDGLGYRRCEWKCDSLNAASRSAAVRYGFTFEGIFRQAVVYKGRNRDTAWYSIADSEWPALKSAFQSWLDDANFLASGDQRQHLSALTAGILR